MGIQTQLSKIRRLFNAIDYNNHDNLHLIAISNLNDPTRKMERWWVKKYKQPLKPYGEHTLEELAVEMLEDFYDNNPTEIERFLDSLNREKEPEWNGHLDAESERIMQAKWKKKKQIDLTQFQSDIVLSDEETKNLIDNLGRDLKKKIVVKNKEVEEEFDESFLGE